MPRPDRKPDKYGAEHDVFLSDDGWRVLKFGRNFGFVPVVAGGKLALKPATPEEYLVRHALMERIFPTGIQVDGLTDSGCFVISQRAITGNHPTEWGVRKYLRKLGFVNIPASFGQGGMAWFHRELGVLVVDTAPDNFVASKPGVVPVDLVIAELEGEFLELAAAVEGVLQQAPTPGG